MEKNINFNTTNKDKILKAYAPEELLSIAYNQDAIPNMANNPLLLKQINTILPSLPTVHNFHLANSTNLSFIPNESVHLVVTSPPYWNLKKYNDNEDQLGNIANYDSFLSELEKVWKECYRILVPGGRLVCVVGDVCRSRKKNNGRHTVVPLHASIQEICRKIGYDNLAPIIWFKISNAKFESPNGSSFLGKPYEPNAIIKNDIEYILMERKSGGYRNPSFLERKYSVISNKDQKKWFNQIWADITGASTKKHPAPFPLELATRLVKMFSFVGDTVVDPFLGTGTTSLASWMTGRNSIGIELDNYYLSMALSRFNKESSKIYRNHTVNVFRS